MARSEDEVDSLLDEVRAEYADEEREAAEFEMFQAKAGIVEVRLPPDVYSAVRERARREKTTAQALLAEWVIERASTGDDPGSLAAALESLRRSVERVEKLARPNRGARAAS